MDFTSRMVALLGAMRRERNGAVADAMCCYGAPYGLNYGVSLPTIRVLARAETPDADFAKYLYLQDIRELRLAALHITRPDFLSFSDLPAWAAGIVNSEVAEEAAFALFAQAGILPELFDAWIGSPEPLLRYTALMSASRAPHPRTEWIGPAWDAVRRPIADGKLPAGALRLVAQGVVALLAVIGSRNEENRQAVLRAAGSPDAFPAADFIREELAWRLEG